jgi:anti-sigma B factor antagonist
MENISRFETTLVDDKSFTIVKLSGYLDAHTAPNLEKVISELFSQEKLNLVFNFKNLDYISSAGLGVFMSFIEEIREKGGDIVLCEMSDKIYTIFDLLGFPLLFRIFKNERDAFSVYL